jgi:hypothetical protein
MLLLFLLCFGIAGSYCLLTAYPSFLTLHGGTSEGTVIEETFNTGYLDPGRWEMTREGDTHQSLIEVVPISPSDQDEYRLRLGMDTIGTMDDTVKYIGIKSRESINLRQAHEISFDLDWNNQSNGCYLTAGFFLCSMETSTNPEREPEWLKIEYIGVPPGKNARVIIAIKADDSVRFLYTEGWPEERSGRPVGYQRIVLIPDTKGITILENGSFLYYISKNNLNLESGYLYFQLSSHSNYPFREIYFDNIIVK